jgi:hypothetical protein
MAGNAEYDPWPPPEILFAAQEAVWGEYVGRVVLPSAAIWENMTAYLQEQSPDFFTLYRSEPSKVKTQWNIEHTALHGVTGQAMRIEAAIETETPLAKLHDPDEAEAALMRLGQCDRWPDPDWPSHRGKSSIPGDVLLADHPTFVSYVAAARNILDVRLQTTPVADRNHELLPGFVKKESYVRIFLDRQFFNTKPSPDSPQYFRSTYGIWDLKNELILRAEAGRLALPVGDMEAARAASDRVLREALPWRIGSGLEELERIHLILTGQLQEDDWLRI